MSDEINNETPILLWLIGGAALIWNLFGTWVYVMTVSATPDELAASFDASQIAFMDAVPAWATSANAIAVTAGVLACILLLLRNKLALPLFIASLAALLVQDVYSFVIVDVVAVLGVVQAYIQGTVLAIAVLLLFYARGKVRSGFLA